MRVLDLGGAPSVLWLFSFLSAAAVFACSSDPESNDATATGGAGGTMMLTGGTGGSTTDTGGSASGGASGGTGGTTSSSYPESLRASGLYAGDTGETLADGVHEFKPRFVLYSDNAEKRRFIWIPEGETIDTSAPDYWDFPVGTKVWKEFTRDSVRVETRYLEKRQNGSWWRIAYQWNDAQTDALPVPDGVMNASGTDHDIPSRDDCASCHGRTQGEILGFSAIQLGFDSDLFDLADLNSANLLSDPVANTFTLPGDTEDQAALGYLHVNCGTCHNPTSNVQGRVDMDLRLRIDMLSDLSATPVCTTAVDQDISVMEGSEPVGATLRIDPGSSATSAAFLRMNSRGETYSMPPLGTELIDDNAGTGVELIEAWIDSLAASDCTPP